MLKTCAPIRGLLFDLDGTLVDTIKDITAAVNCALATIEAPSVSTDLVMQFVGHGLTNTLKNLLNHLKIECDQECLARLNTQLRHCYQAQPYAMTTIYSGVEELLQRAHADNVALGILSNKDQLLVELIQAELFPEIPFTLVRGAQKDKALKPDPNGALAFAELANISPAEVLLVGDSTVDAETAKRAQMQFAWAGWGFGQLPEIDSEHIYLTPYALFKEVFL